MHIAAKNGSKKIVTILLSANADVLLIDVKGRKALDVAENEDIQAVLREGEEDQLNPAAKKVKVEGGRTDAEIAVEVEIDEDDSDSDDDMDSYDYNELFGGTIVGGIRPGWINEHFDEEDDDDEDSEDEDENDEEKDEEDEEDVKDGNGDDDDDDVDVDVLGGGLASAGERSAHNHPI